MNDPAFGTLTGATMLTQNGSADYPTTRWTLVVAAGNEDRPGSHEALSTLCTIYWYPLYAFVRRSGRDASLAQDLVQDFFASLIARRFFNKAVPEKGSFRSFLLGSLKLFLADERDRANALKRGGGTSVLPFDVADGEAIYLREPSHNETPERIFERRWARAVLDRAFNRLKDDFISHGRLEHFNHIKGYLAGGGEVPYAELAQKLGTSEGALKTGIHRLRKRYRDLLREEVEATVDGPSAVDSELRFLATALSAK